MPYTPQFLDLAELSTRIGAARLARLADRDCDGAGDDEVLLGAISGAEHEVLEHLRPRFGDRLPATPAATPDGIKDVVAQLAYYRLHQTAADLVPEHLDTAYRLLVARMRSWANGQADPGIETPPPTSSSHASRIVTTTPRASAITLASLEDW